MRVVAGRCGWCEDRLLRLYRARETVKVSSDPEKKARAGVGLVYEPPKYWGTGKYERVKNEAMPNEPSTFLVWAWTIDILTGPASKLEVIPDVVASDKPDPREAFFDRRYPPPSAFRSGANEA